MKCHSTGLAAMPAVPSRITVEIPADKKAELQAVAKKMGLDLSNFVRLTLYATLPKDEQAV